MEFQIKEYGKNISLIATYTREKPVQGLPLKYSNCIMFGQEDLCELIKVLQEYANKTRDSGI